MPRPIHRVGRAILRAFPFLRRGRIAHQLFKRFPPIEEELQVTLPEGSRMLIYMPDVVSFNIYLRGYYQPEIVHHIRRLLRPGMTFFDVGAHFGQFALAAASILRPGGSVHAFEPGIRQLRYLEHNVRINNYSHVFVNRVAVGDTEGVVGFAESPNDFVASHVVEAGDCALKVPMTTLDRYCRDKGIATIDVLKIDVEGAQLQVLKGMARMLAEAPPKAIFYECIEELSTQYGHPPEDTHNLLLSHGYKLYTAQRRALVPAKPPYAAGAWDFAAVRE